MHFHMQRFEFMVTELRFFKKNKKMKNMAKKLMWKALFVILRMSYIPDRPIFIYWLFFTHILHLDFIKSEINLKLKVKMKNILIYGFQWG